MKIDYSKLDDPKLKEQYQKEITSKMEEIKEDENQQEKWNKTCEILKNTAEKVLGKKKKQKKTDNQEITALSEKKTEN